MAQRMSLKRKKSLLMQAECTRAAKAQRSHALIEQMEEDPASGASTLNSSILLPGPDDENSSSSESDKSSDEDYTQEDANAAYQHWLLTLDREVVRMIAMMISDDYVVRFGLTKTNVAAKEVSLLLGLNEKLFVHDDKTSQLIRGSFLNTRGYA